MDRLELIGEAAETSAGVRARNTTPRNRTAWYSSATVLLWYRLSPGAVRLQVSHAGDSK